MTVGIIGSGTMGSGIAQVAATADCKVLVFDTNQKALYTSKEKLDSILTRLIEKGKIDDTKKLSIQNNIQYISDLSGFKSSDLIIEAIVEDAEIKKTVFKGLEEHVSMDCIIASNTSSLSITSLAACLKNPNRFIGIHFFNPAPLMKLVEVIPAIQTEIALVRQFKETITGWGKDVVIAKDTPGFIVNKVARSFYGESIRIYEEGLADQATIDWAMKALGGFKMGPFELMDFIGNDINYTVTETVYKAFFYDSRFRPSFTQKRLAEAGYLGRKSGRGHYDYSEGAEMPEPDKDEVEGQKLVDRVLTMLINEAADTLHYHIASRDDIDTAMTKGVNYPKGLLRWADQIGIQTCVERMDELYFEYHEERYRCSPLLRKMAREQTKFYEE